MSEVGPVGDVPNGELGGNVLRGPHEVPQLEGPEFDRLYSWLPDGDSQIL